MEQANASALRAQELQAAGHRCRICTHAQFEDFVRSEGVEFYPMAGEDGARA